MAVSSERFDFAYSAILSHLKPKIKLISGEEQLFCDLGYMLGGESISFESEVHVDADALASGTLYKIYLPLVLGSQEGGPDLIVEDMVVTNPGGPDTNV